MELPGLSFHLGIGVQDVIKSKFGCSVSPDTPDRAFFFLVASFGRCEFRLSPETVGTILQATLGGSAVDFSVLALADRVFRFSVSSRLVGFHIFKLRSFVCSAFKIFFHLWSNGGPNWVREWILFCHEEDAAWSVPSKKRVDQGKSLVRKELSFADAVRKNMLTGANSVPIQTRQNVRQNIFSRLSFPEFAGKSFNKGKAPIGQVHQDGPMGFDRSRNLNFGSSSSQQMPAKNLSSALQTGICSRCLSPGHAREACRSSIRCFNLHAGVGTRISQLPG